MNKTTKESLIEGADDRLADYIPKEIDILHEIKSDRIFCSRQAVLNLIKDLIDQAHTAGRKEALEAVTNGIGKVVMKYGSENEVVKDVLKDLTDIKNHLSNK